jgi:hypothetical protein
MKQFAFSSAAPHAGRLHLSYYSVSVYSTRYSLRDVSGVGDVQLTECVASG